MLACLAPNGTAQYHGTETLSEVLVGTVDGVAVIVRDANEWALETTNLSGTHISSLFHDANHDLVFAASHAGGVWRSFDHGRSWSKLDGQFADLNVYTVTGIERDGSLELYVGTEPVRLYRSTDHGATWERLPAIESASGHERWTFPAPPHIGHLKNLTFHPTDADRLLASIEQGGLYLSRDRGGSWVELEGIAHPSDHVYKDVHRVVLHPRNPSRMWITGGDGISMSDDGGTTWRKLTDRNWTIGYPDGFLVSPGGDTVVVAGASRTPPEWATQGGALASVARSTDGGDTWEPAAEGLPSILRGNIEAMVGASAGDEWKLLLATTDGEVYLSDDAATWNLVTDSLAPVSKVIHFMLTGSGQA